MFEEWTDAWEAMEADAEDRFQTAALVMLCLRFSDDAHARAMRAEEQLLAAQRRAEVARDYLNRTTETLEQALHLYAHARPSWQ
jgi:hypothetical protein